MAQWVNGDIIKVTARLRSATGEDIENVYHYLCDFTTSVLDENVIAVILSTIDVMYDKFQPEIPSDVTFVDIDITNVTQDLVYAARSWPVQTVGGGTGDTMPEQACALVVGRTNKPKVVGRKFLGPIYAAANQDGAWHSTLLGMLADYIVQYLAIQVLSSGNQIIPVVAKYIAGVYQSYTELTEAYTSSGIYTQRRRRRGVGS